MACLSHLALVNHVRDWKSACLIGLRISSCAEEVS
jgi:hypothetical protein